MSSLGITDESNDSVKTTKESVTSTDPYPNVTQDKNINFESINEVLNFVFKHDGFRSELQRDAIVHACKFDKDLFVSLPTGSGKSLIYQLPAVYQNRGVTMVVSPLVALISNQISNAKKLGIPCATINSHMTKSWNMQVKSEITSKDPKLRLLYITPETLCSDHFQPHLHTMDRNKTLKLFAIDEAHCVSSWGHEFRPDYLKLGQLRKHFPNVPIVALTATATSKVLKDILSVLNLREPKHVVAPTFRKNLFYDVIRTDTLDGKILEDLTVFLKEYLNIKTEKKKPPRLAPKRKMVNEKAVTSSPGGTFVSAASLITAEDSKQSTSGNHTSLKRKKPAVLAKESARITSFFKRKASEVKKVDLDSTVVSIGDTSLIGFNDSKGEINLDQADDDIEIVGFKPAKSLIDAKEASKKSPPKRELTPEPVVKAPESDGVAIVYCRTKINCEDVAAHLDKHGVSARPYHSGLTSKQRTEIEGLWMDEKVRVICATISFGMGIDKKNVRVVVHFNMSQSLANYYQESGRAGRDGKQAHCRLYYSPTDQSAITFLIRKDMELEASDHSFSKLGPEACKRKRETARAAMERFERMVDYCKSTNRCRHLLLAREFSLADEKGLVANGCGKSCDRCFRLKQVQALDRLPRPRFR